MMFFNKKSILAICIVSALCLILLPSSAFAEGAVTFGITFDDDFVVGNEVGMVITINNALGTDGGQFDLSFDPEIIVPVDFLKGDFVPESTGTDINLISSNLELEEGKLRVLWAIGDGSEKASGVLGTIVFDVVGEGETTLVFSDLKVTDPDAEDDMAEVETPVVEETEAVDTATAKERAIKAADDAIAALPEPVTLADSAAIKAARDLVEEAKDKHDAVDGDFVNLEVLEDAEALYAKLRAIQDAKNAIDNLPSVDALALDDEDDVVAARVLVNAAKDDHDATDAEIGTDRLETLRKAENRIAELKGEKPTPPTGGEHYLFVVGLLILVAGVWISYSRNLFDVK